MSVSELTTRLKIVVEREFVDLSVEGEKYQTFAATPPATGISLSRTKQPPYAAPVSVCRIESFGFVPEDGLRVIASGCIRYTTPGASINS